MYKLLNNIFHFSLDSRVHLLRTFFNTKFFSRYRSLKIIRTCCWFPQHYKNPTTIQHENSLPSISDECCWSFRNYVKVRWEKRRRCDDQQSLFSVCCCIWSVSTLTDINFITSCDDSHFYRGNCCETSSTSLVLFVSL